MAEPGNAPGLESVHVLLYHSGLVCDLTLSGLLPSFMIKAESGRQSGPAVVAVAGPLKARLGHQAGPPEAPARPRNSDQGLWLDPWDSAKDQIHTHPA